MINLTEYEIILIRECLKNTLKDVETEKSRLNKRFSEKAVLSLEKDLLSIIEKIQGEIDEERLNNEW